uniref:Protein aael aael003544 aedes aegypti n=1 Tax=Corethrella appendiculata TaxID=1370023 RepID=U5EVB1_9DIPT
MSITFEQIILDAKRIANRLKDREALGDSILLESENVNKQMESMRQFQDDIDVLNKLARERSNNQLITIINQENPQIREIRQENRQLKEALEEHQHALEHIMTKYREHTQSKILNSKINFVELYNNYQKIAENKDEIIKKQTEKIQEMAAIMQKASVLDEDKINMEHEYLSRLITENKGLREMLEISQKFGSNKLITSDDKSTQTEVNEKQSVSTSEEGTVTATEASTSSSIPVPTISSNKSENKIQSSGGSKNSS